MTTHRRWVIGYVHAGAELSVVDQLGGIGIEAYCPTFTKWVRKRKWRRRETEEVERALFQGYVFADLASIANMEAVYRVPGFRYFIRNQGDLSLVSDAIMSEVRAIERMVRQKSSRRRANPSLAFAIGQLVKVLDGACGGMVGEVAMQGKSGVTLTGYDFTIPTTLPAGNLKATA